MTSFNTLSTCVQLRSGARVGQGRWGGFEMKEKCTSLPVRYRGNSARNEASDETTNNAEFTHRRVDHWLKASQALAFIREIVPTEQRRVSAGVPERSNTAERTCRSPHRAEITTSMLSGYA
jgi:hypothetical protein